MPAGEQIAFEPALALVLAEHLHHAAVGRDVIVVGKISAIEQRLVTSSTSCQRFELFSSGLNRRKFVVEVQLHDVAQELAHGRASPRRRLRPGCGNVDGVVAEVGQSQVAQQQAAVGVRIGAHAALALRRQLGELGLEPARSRRTVPRGR